MVSITVGTIEPAWLAAPDTDTIRDLFILLVNQLGAHDLEETADALPLDDTDERSRPARRDRGS